MADSEGQPEDARRGRAGVDVGGTFTDLVALIDGGIVTAKVPTTPHDQSEGVLHAIHNAALDPPALGVLAHGMTVATNALLERRGARTALITTEGFRDVLEIGRQNRPSLYDLTRDRPPALVPRPLRLTVRERMGPHGVLVPLDEESVAQVIGTLRAARVNAVAVCLLFSFLYPEHEQRIGAAIRRALPGLHVSLSCEVLPEFREYERLSTTVADAYLAPGLSAYLARLAGRTDEMGLPRPLVMQSSGGVIGIDDAARHAAACVLSGPAGGVIGAAYVAAASGYRDVLTFDMGGTSTDVAAVLDGRVQTTTESVVAGVPIKLPMVDVHTVSAGGGSIARVDSGGVLQVGPRSAGALPGPAAYGRGGTEPTVTDANLCLGYLSDSAPLGGSVRLDWAQAQAALERIGAQVGLGVTETALGIVRVANAGLARALRVISVERGLDPRRFALVAFGGAGGLHACALCEELGIRRILLPRACGVLSALGLAIAAMRRDYVRPFRTSLTATDVEELERAFAMLEERARSDLHDPVLHRQADLRYRGQSFELTVDYAHNYTTLQHAFHTSHLQRYGYAMLEEEIEIVNLRLAAVTPGEQPVLREGLPSRREPAGRRIIVVDGRQVEATVWRRAEIGQGSTLNGPALVEFDEATCLVRPGWRGTVDAAGTLILEAEP